MAITRDSQNYSFKIPGDVEDGDIFIECNFTQKYPNTIIFEGKNNLQFIRCNLTNCIIPNNSFNDANITHVEFCYHLHSGFELSVEIDDCKHVIMKKIIEGKEIFIRDDLFGVDPNLYEQRRII